jgi:tetratricopeptide (TPR) repeat protein
VSESGNKAVVIGLAISLAELCLFAGCSPAPRPVVNQYVDAVALRELGQEQLAIEKLNAVVATDPAFTPAYVELGKAYEATGDYPKALTAFRRAARLDTWSFENHLNLARMCEKLEGYPEAAATYARAAELNPKSFEALLGAARCYLMAGEYVKSLTYCELAAKMDKPQEVLPLLARIYEGQKDYEQAIQVYQRLLVVRENDPNVLLPLGVTYARAGQFERARQVLMAVTQLRPRDGAAYRHLGYCLIKLGDTDQAVQMYQKAVDFDGNDWEAHRGLGVACMLKARQTAERHWQSKALEHWRRSLALRPDQPKHKMLEKLIRENSTSNDPLPGLSY